MQPDPGRSGVPRRALALYTVVAASVSVAAATLFGMWLLGLGLPWPPVMVGTALGLKLLVWLEAPLSVPAIYWLVRRWPFLDRDGVLAREDDPHAA